MNMETEKSGLEPLSLKRANIAEGGRVQYRVYKNPNEFVHVAADSALMAIRASGITAPFKIVREQAGDGGKIDTARLVQASVVTLEPAATKSAKEELAQYFTELAEKPEQESLLFVPMGLADLRNKGMTRARILPAEMLQEIIEDHVKQQTQAPEPQVPAEPAAQTEPVATPEPTPEILRPPEPSPAERLAQLADEVLTPPAEEAVTAPVAEAEPELSPDEVAKLLNG